MATTPIQAQSPYNPTTTVNDLGQGNLGKEDFLKLLVAQLSHQDPTAPTDPSEFVAQLSQFSSLEQLANIKSGMDLLAITQTAGTSAQMVSFIGKDVTFDAGQVSWTKDAKPVSMSLTLDRPAAEVEQRIVDANGQTVDTRSLGALSGGAHAIVFDGKRADGSALPVGTYHIEISAKDVAGKTVDVSLRDHGTVSAVTFEAGYPQLVLSSGRVLGLGQVISMLAPAGTIPTPDTSDTTDATDDDPGVVDPTHTDNATP